MLSILYSLYNCAMEKVSQDFLSQDELHNYQSAICHEKALKQDLEQLLEGESLRLFRLYIDNRDDEGAFASISAFRKGLTMGLKLGALSASEF